MNKFFYLLALILLSITNSISAQSNILAAGINGSVLITSKTDKQTAYGSGFFYSSANKIFLVTASHVLFDFKKRTNGPDSLTYLNDTITITFYKGNPYIDNKNIFTLNLKELLIEGRIGIDRLNDVAIIYLGDFVRNQFIFGKEYIKRTLETRGNITGYDIKGSKSMNDVEIADDVFIFGYPKSLGVPADVRSFDTDRPLLRKGIVAGLDKRNTRIILDCPSYPGNSGGPVFESTTKGYKLIGFIDQFIPFEEPSFNLIYKRVMNMQINNSGYSVVVPIDFVNMAISHYFK